MCFRPADLSVAPTCKKCGVENEAGAEVCTSCGAELPKAQGMPGIPSAPPPGASRAAAPQAPRAPQAPTPPRAN